MAPQAGDECIVIFANDSWYRVIRSNDPNLEKIKHPRHDLNHGIALVGMSLNPARPDRERTMREAPSPKEGVLEISNGNSSLALNEEGLVEVITGNGALTLTNNGKFSVRSGDEELISLFDQTLSLLGRLLTINERNGDISRMSPEQQMQLSRIRAKLHNFLVGGSNSGTDNSVTDGGTGGVVNAEPEGDRNPPQPPIRIAISSGHSHWHWGAYNVDTGMYEYFEAVKVVDRVAEILRGNEPTVVEVTTFHDRVGVNANGVDNNLTNIISFHNSIERDLDVSIHFNSFTVLNNRLEYRINEELGSPEARRRNVIRAGVGTEVLYRHGNNVTQQIATDISRGIHLASGNEGERLINRGAKPRPNPNDRQNEGPLDFLENEHARNPILIEVCFVNSRTDVAIYRDKFEEICVGIANSLIEAARTN